jgi:hypothetical protein
MSYTPEVSELRVTNFQYLRDQALKRLRREGVVDWTDDEIEAIGDLLAEFAGKESSQRKYQNCDWRENEGLLILSRDLDELSDLYPKWAALVAWLAPESPIVVQAPDLIELIARAALRGTLHKYRTS